MRCTRIDTRELHRDRWTRLRHDTVRWENGVQAQFSVIERMAGAAVLPIAKDGTIVLVREFKYALGEYSLEAEAGGIEEGEAPLAAAQRELLEETGLTARHWRHLAAFHTSNSVTDEAGDCFVAWGLAQEAPQPDDTEVLRLRRLPLREACAMAADGRITDAITLIALQRLELLALRGDLPDDLLAAARRGL